MNKTLHQKRCIPCQGGIPPLNKSEIDHFIEKLNSDWKVYKSKEIKENIFLKHIKRQ